MIAPIVEQIAGGVPAHGNRRQKVRDLRGEASRIGTRARTQRKRSVAGISNRDYGLGDLSGLSVGIIGSDKITKFYRSRPPPYITICF